MTQEEFNTALFDASCGLDEAKRMFGTGDDVTVLRNLSAELAGIADALEAPEESTGAEINAAAAAPEDPRLTAYLARNGSAGADSAPASGFAAEFEKLTKADEIVRDALTTTLERRLVECTAEQQGFFHKIVPNGIASQDEHGLRHLVDLVNRTLAKNRAGRH